MFTILPHISRIILASSAGFVCGVFVASFFVLAIDVVFFLCFIFSICVFVVWYGQYKSWSGVIFLVCVSFGFFVMTQYDHAIHYTYNNTVLVKNGIAVVDGDVVQKGWYAQVPVRYEDEDFLTLIKDERNTARVRGDVIDLSCTRQLPENFDDFDYRMYLAMRGIYFVCDDPSYNVVGHQDTVGSTITRARSIMENVVATVIPAPESALANGLLFGGSDRLSENMRDQFAQTGMTHIVAVSGYNVSIIIAVVMGMLIFVGVHRRYAVLGAMISVVFFVALIGFPASGIRAAIMGVLVLIAASYGRIAHAYGAILLSAALMLAYDPLLLRYDIGFQLSFLATLGIVVIYPLFERYFITKNIAFGIVEVLLLTLSAQVFVLPIIAYHFHTVSIVSLVVNVLVLPIIPPTMLFVFLLLVASMVFYPLALFFGWIAYFMLAYEVYVIGFFADLSWGAITFDAVSVLGIVAYYIVMCSVIFLLNRNDNIYEQ